MLQYSLGNLKFERKFKKQINFEIIVCLLSIIDNMVNWRQMTMAVNFNNEYYVYPFKIKKAGYTYIGNVYTNVEYILGTYLK